MRLSLDAKPLGYATVGGREASYWYKDDEEIRIQDAIQSSTMRRLHRSRSSPLELGQKSNTAKKQQTAGTATFSAILGPGAGFLGRQAFWTF